MKHGQTQTVAILVLRSAECLVGIPAQAVERVFAAVEIAPLPGAPTVVAGVINVHGRVMPVLGLRRRLGFEPSLSTLTARLVVVAKDERSVALLADGVDGVVEMPRQALSTMEALLPGAGFIRNVIPTRDGLILVHDVDAFFTAGEEETLAAALSRLAA